MKKVLLTLTLLAITSHMYAMNKHTKKKLKLLNEALRLVAKGASFKQHPNLLVGWVEPRSTEMIGYYLSKSPHDKDRKIITIIAFENPKSKNFTGLQIQTYMHSIADLEAKGLGPDYPRHVGSSVNFTPKNLKNPHLKKPLMELFEIIKRKAKLTKKREKQAELAKKDIEERTRKFKNDATKQKLKIEKEKFDFPKIFK